MPFSLKKITKNIFNALGYELCRLNEIEQTYKNELDLHFDYKDYQLIRALAVKSQLSIDEAAFLGELVKSSDPSKPIIEIGTLFGWSTLVITLFKPRDQPLITVDNYSWNPLGMSPEAHFTATRLRLADVVNHANVQQIRMDKDQFYKQYSGEQPALFFCDANHGYEETLADLQWAKKIGADIICGDDYTPNQFPGVIRAVAEMGGAKKVVDELFLI